MVKCGRGRQWALGEHWFAPVCSCHVHFLIFRGDLMDAFFGLERSKQMDEKQQEGERARRQAQEDYVWTAASRPSFWSDRRR